MNQLTFETVLEYGKQLLTVFEADDLESSCQKNILETTQQVAALRAKQQEWIKQDVLYLTSEGGVSGDNLDTGGDGLGGVDAVSRAEKVVQSKVESLRKQSEAVVRECRQLKEQLAQLQREEEALKEQRHSHKQSRKNSLPKARCDFNLYTNITNLRWQFNCEPQEIKGYICNKSDVKTFNLNSQEVSKFFISNYLWDLIEEDW